MVLGMLLSILPFSAAEALNTIALLLALGMLILGLYVPGLLDSGSQKCGSIYGRRVTQGHQGTGPTAKTVNEGISKRPTI